MCHLLLLCTFYNPKEMYPSKLGKLFVLYNENKAFMEKEARKKLFIDKEHDLKTNWTGLGDQVK